MRGRFGVPNKIVGRGHRKEFIILNTRKKKLKKQQQHNNIIRITHACCPGRVLPNSKTTGTPVRRTPVVSKLQRNLIAEPLPDGLVFVPVPVIMSVLLGVYDVYRCVYAALKFSNSLPTQLY